MGIGCDDGARVLEFCTIASREIHLLQAKRSTMDLSQDGIHGQILKD
jgi:hypothetical protein